MMDDLFFCFFFAQFQGLFDQFYINIGTHFYTHLEKRKGDPFGSPFPEAEEEGFEPPVRVNVRRFSRPVHSTSSATPPYGATVRFDRLRFCDCKCTLPFGKMKPFHKENAIF